MPTVSVVLATRNQACWLDQAIAGVRAQTYTDWDLWVVDDGSTDDTPRLLQEYGDDLYKIAEEGVFIPAALYVQQRILAYPKKELATNEKLVERIVRVARDVGREIATPDEAREILGLERRRIL